MLASSNYLSIYLGILFHDKPLSDLGMSSNLEKFIYILSDHQLSKLM